MTGASKAGRRLRGGGHRHGWVPASAANVMSLEIRNPAEVAIDVDQRGSVMNGRRRDPRVVLAETHPPLGQQPIEDCGAKCNRLRERDFSQSPQEESDRFLIASAGELTDRDGRAAETLSAVPAQEGPHGPYAIVGELVLEIDEDACIKEQHGASGAKAVIAPDLVSIAYASWARRCPVLRAASATRATRRPSSPVDSPAIAPACRCSFRPGSWRPLASAQRRGEPRGS